MKACLMLKAYIMVTIPLPCLIQLRSMEMDGTAGAYAQLLLCL